VPETLISPTGHVLRHQAKRTTTPSKDKSRKVVHVRQSKEDRLAENLQFLNDKNVSAFLMAIADAEGGGYDFKYGAVKGRRNDPWRFSDYSTHPGPGFGGTTAAGMYQITKDTWQQHGIDAMGLNDFSPKTQDLIAVELLRSVGVIEKIQAGNITDGLAKASRKWAALPQGPGLANQYPRQPYMKYGDFIANYERHGGTGK
jgi:muramidase (phage lysozyme)